MGGNYAKSPYVTRCLRADTLFIVSGLGDSFQSHPSTIPGRLVSLLKHLHVGVSKSSHSSYRLLVCLKIPNIQCPADGPGSLTQVCRAPRAPK